MTEQKNIFPEGLGLASPAKRALISAGYKSLKDLANVSEKELSQLHGMGPNALKLLLTALREEGLSLKK